MKKKTEEKKKSLAHVQLLVLRVLEKEDMYGYQIITELSRRSGNAFEMKEGTLYPVLHGFCKDALLESYEKTAPSGKLRKYYHITEKGKKTLEKERKDWEAYQLGVNRVLEYTRGYAREELMAGINAMAREVWGPNPRKDACGLDDVVL